MIDHHGNAIDHRTITDDGRIRLFVYGTLMHDFYNAETLVSAEQADRYERAEWTAATSVEEHFIMSGYGYPVLGEDPSDPEAGPVYGELVTVDLDTLCSRVDALEGHPGWYVREPRQFVAENGSIVWAYVYLQSVDEVYRHGQGMIYGKADFRKYYEFRSRGFENFSAAD